MNQAQKAAEDIKHFANKFKGLLEIADAIESIGSLEQASSEAKSMKESAQKELEPIQKLLNEKKAELASVQDSIKSAIANANGIEIAAQKKHDQILKEGREAVKVLNDDVNKRRADLGGDLIRHEANLNSIKGQVEEKKAELALILEHIADAKAKIASIAK